MAFQILAQSLSPPSFPVLPFLENDCLTATTIEEPMGVWRLITIMNRVNPGQDDIFRQER